MNEYPEPTGRWLREEDAREALIQNAVIVALLVLTAIYFCWLVWMKARQPVVERAAYLEGRWGLDPDTARVYAVTEEAK